MATAYGGLPLNSGPALPERGTVTECQKRP